MHITRARDWFESEKRPILLDQWRRYVENDPEMKIDPVNNHRDDEFMVLWFGEGEVPDDTDGIGWFCWIDGKIDTKYPDAACIRKMLRIADELDARLQGDEGEECRDDGGIWEYEYIDKSSFAKRLGYSVHRPTLVLDIGALMGSLVGQTEASLRKSLKQIEAMSPCVVMIDEVEKAITTGENDSGVSARMFELF